MRQIKLEIGKYRKAFDIPDSVKEVTVDRAGNKIVVEMVPDKAPKPGDVMVNKHGSVYIFESVEGKKGHWVYVWLSKSGRLVIGGVCQPGRLATPEEAQPLWDALKKAGKRWNPETMQVEETPDVNRIREWVASHWKAGYYSQDLLGAVIFCYLEDREGEK